ncbi:hypothetical protein GCM10007425_02110 [Lysinibacillus alkalisoli]|uniref:HTH marR-type domain-containing protein n=1 Tax=Lysinibacillus alkalisoli TaxID=1911548 RepID=A0A917FX51_9BACI|nr:MarR family transcriptional regulator [Lysinibacillus alkalisoli]GGG11391.1 hypothetical protein GCM10007425_02110 [Lysinibacillus alkalisoli]
MEQKKRETISSLFEIAATLERKWTNDWNTHNTLGFSKTHILLLDFLANEGPKRPSAIAEHLQVTSGGVTVLTTKLLKSGFIEKNQQTVDRRASQIVITEKGQELLEQSRQQIETLVNNMFGMLSYEELATLRTIFTKCLTPKP